MTATAGHHETRALLRAHLAAATGYRHITRTCPVCHRLLRLATERAEPGPSAERAEPGPAAAGSRGEAAAAPPDAGPDASGPPAAAAEPHGAPERPGTALPGRDERPPEE
ncbi:DUF6274 family protein [Streptomyces genisteinicus]|uniref:Uncharacterized protein n=1 Tax=Streptomyces genisteinicus TaxID=2768068 RepID=A0A7H0I4N5_9ACTN|nr:DUF6274 family protein [Streptomyces genisteinicus]QNP67751.1 hypothetical protein IAG43_14870 [Streptomyces genisteinicus]